MARPGLRVALVLGVLAVPLLAACSSHQQGHPDPADAVPDKVCGLFDRDRVVALGLPLPDIGSRGQIAARQVRHDDTITCTVLDRRTQKVVVRVVVADLDPGQVDKATSDVLDEFAVRREDPSGPDDEALTTCSRPDALSSLGTGYACSGNRLITLDLVVPGRLVRMAYHPLRTEPVATEYARAIGLIGNLQENVVAYDQANPSLTPSPTS